MSGQRTRLDAPGSIVAVRLDRYSRARPSATSWPTSSPTSRSRGTRSPSSPTRARSPRSSCSRSRARSKFSETVFVYPPSAEGHVRIRIFTPTLELPFAGHPILGTAFVLAGPLQLDGDPARDAARRRAGAARARRLADRLRLDDAAAVLPRAVRPTPTRCSRCSECEARSPVELYRQGPAARRRRARFARGGRCASSRLRRARGSSRRTERRASRATATRGRRACSSRRTACPRIPRPARPPGRSRSTSPGTAGSSSAQEIEIHQGAEIDRPSTLYAVARSETEIEVGGSAVVVARGEFRL